MFRTACVPSRLRSSALASISAVALLSIAACGPYHQAPREEHKSNPTITYSYAGDQELVTANQKAIAHCASYNATAQTLNITENTDGTRSVTFECVPTMQAAVPVPAPNPNLAYTFSTDRELLQASQAAYTYCSNQGRRAVTSSISPVGGGTRTVTFQCVPA
jgi:hypothetical protein